MQHGEIVTYAEEDCITINDKSVRLMRDISDHFRKSEPHNTYSHTVS